MRSLKSGFTLIELLVVVVIVGILATLAVPGFQRAMERARQAEARDMLGQMYQAEVLYYAEKDTYTKATDDLMAGVPPADDTGYYFSYTVTAAGATTFSLSATRKDATATTAGGRDPAGPVSYSITLDQTGEYKGGSY